METPATFAAATPPVSEQEHRHALIGLDIIDTETGAVVTSIGFTHDEIDMPGYVESIERNYTDTQWRPVRVWRTHASPADLADVGALIGLLHENVFPAALEAARIRTQVHGTQPLLHELLTGTSNERGKQIGHDLMQVCAAIMLRLDEYSMSSAEYRNLLAKARNLLAPPGC